MANLFLGFDSSTQGLTATVIDYDARRIAAQAAVNFADDLPRHGTHNGVLPHDDPRVAESPPLMWVEALDAAFERLVRGGVDLGAVRAVAGSGQQHGSVYLNARAPALLAGLDAARPLAGQLEPALARDRSPVWMDASTTAECDEIRSALGGARAVAELTGSTTFERFTGPQIRRIWKREPATYEATAHIALVSSFMASILAGRVAPIDHGDGAGMNLMDIRRRRWSEAALDATAPGLAGRLPPLAPSATVLGPVAPYFAARYGLRPGALALAWSGDNPCSLVGTGLVKPGRIAISLGTSDTCFGFMEDCRTDPAGEGHVFGAPTGDYMSLVCLKNGSLAREAVRDAHGLDWSGFERAVREAPPGNGGRIMLPWFAPEIVPKVLRAGVRRFGLEEGDAPGNCRAVVEAQMMAMRLHTRWMGAAPDRIHATGGASRNAAILRIMADVHGCPVYRFETTNSAALGAALRAAHASLRDAGRPADWERVVAGFTEPVADSRVDPDPKAKATYDALVERYAAREREALGAS